MKSEHRNFVSRAHIRLNQLDAELRAARQEMADTPENEWELLDRIAAGYYEHAWHLLGKTLESDVASNEAQVTVSDALTNFGNAVEALRQRRVRG